MRRERGPDVTIFVKYKLLTWKDVRLTAEAGWARFGLVCAEAATPCHSKLDTKLLTGFAD